MSELNLMAYAGVKPTWCPGCGDYAILNGIKQALVNMEIHPHEIAMYSGIGQAAKLPLYARGNFLNGLHGRGLPIATGGAVANHKLKTLMFGGDGDGFAEGGNHFIHAIRRNFDATYFVHNNQVYGLTKGQASPTSEKGFKTGTTPDGVKYSRFNPAAVAISLGCSLVVRTHTGNLKHMVEMMELAIRHRGFAFVEILQPCVTYNKINTLKWYRDMAYDILDVDGYDPFDKFKAWEKAQEWEEGFPIGVLFRVDLPTMVDNIEVLGDEPLNATHHKAQDVGGLLEAYR